MINIHATSIAYNDMGVLILGKAGSGKSDLALRMIMNKGAVLIADDRTNVEVVGGNIFASCPESIQGLLEVRGVGIKKLPHISDLPVKLIIQLVDNRDEIERLPVIDYDELEGIKLPLLKLFAFDASAPEKLVIKIESLLDLSLSLV